jgi:hypothetical protein
MTVRPRNRVIRFAFSLLPLLVLTACKDSGLPGRNTPVEEAMNAEWRYPLYSVADPLTDPFTAAVSLDGERWVSDGTPIFAPQRLLQPVGTAMDREFFALTTDRRPFSRLYHGVPGGKVRSMVRL